MGEEIGLRAPEMRMRYKKYIIKTDICKINLDILYKNGCVGVVDL